MRSPTEQPCSMWTRPLDPAIWVSFPALTRSYLLQRSTVNVKMQNIHLCPRQSSSRMYHGFRSLPALMIQVRRCVFICAPCIRIRGLWRGNTIYCLHVYAVLRSLWNRQRAYRPRTFQLHVVFKHASPHLRIKWSVVYFCFQLIITSRVRFDLMSTLFTKATIHSCFFTLPIMMSCKQPRPSHWPVVWWENNSSSYFNLIWPCSIKYF